MKSPLFIPLRDTYFSEENIWKWYLNIPWELEQSFLSQREKEFFAEYYRTAGLLRNWRRPFFQYHYSRTFTQAVNHLFSENNAPRILDIGCGTGTQSLFFSLLGAEVIGIDLDSDALSILEKRKIFYEKQTHRALNITKHACNAFTFNYEKIAPIDGIYSMFAFNIMQPSKDLLDLILPHSSDACRLAILDGNNISWLSRCIPSRKRKDRLTPSQFEEELQKRSFTITQHKAGFTIPPVFWRVLPSSLLRPVDRFLGRSWFMAISHQILAQKR